jgi:hypothetical protein
MPASNLTLMSLEEFLECALPSTEMEDLFTTLDQEGTQKLVDSDRLRRRQDWSKLSHQAIGGEAPPLIS